MLKYLIFRSYWMSFKVTDDAFSQRIISFSDFVAFTSWCFHLQLILLFSYETLLSKYALMCRWFSTDTILHLQNLLKQCSSSQIIFSILNNVFPQIILSLPDDDVFIYISFVFFPDDALFLRWCSSSNDFLLCITTQLVRSNFLSTNKYLDDDFTNPFLFHLTVDLITWFCLNDVLHHVVVILFQENDDISDTSVIILLIGPDKDLMSIFLFSQLLFS